jgi:3-dehydrosphinganine reductase
LRATVDLDFATHQLVVLIDGLNTERVLYPDRTPSDRQVSMLNQLLANLAAQWRAPRVAKGKPMGRFAGKKILITGGSAGIGLATARRALGGGAKVCIASRSRERLEAAARDLAAAGRAEAHPVEMDVRDDASVARGVAAAREQLGGLDIVISNAGYAHPGYVEELPMQAFEDMLAVNYLGMVRVTRAVLPELMRAQSGHIAYVSSMLGFMGLYGYTAYAGSKYAIAGFAECLRQEMRPHGIKVSVCYPPTTDTPGLAHENMIKPAETWAIEGSSRIFTADRVAERLLAGISAGRFEILVGMDSAMIWRMQRFMPWLVRQTVDGSVRKQLARKRSPAALRRPGASSWR